MMPTMFQAPFLLQPLWIVPPGELHKPVVVAKTVVIIVTRITDDRVGKNRRM